MSTHVGVRAIRILELGRLRLASAGRCGALHGIRPIHDNEIIGATRRWLERAVIGLELCPFARAPYLGNRVRFQVSAQRSAAGLLDELRAALTHLHGVGAAECETILLIHPWVLTDFIEFNDFLAICDATVLELELEGEIQVASFHPQYQFAGTRCEDIENYTNRSPFPTLHLLRESSVERVLAAVPNPDTIYENNIRRLRELGLAGWQALWSN